jgi:hypothetical protein
MNACPLPWTRGLIQELEIQMNFHSWLAGDLGGAWQIEWWWQRVKALKSRACACEQILELKWIEIQIEQRGSTNKSKFNILCRTSTG